MSHLNRFTQSCRKIVGVGRNYREHAAELGNAVPAKPLLFMKPPSAIILQGQKIEIPLGCQEIHHEIELGVVIGSRGTCKRVPASESMSHVAGYVLALDMTARDFQNEAKSQGHPWTMAKCFDTSCPLGDFIPAASVPDPHNLTLRCSVNGALRQDASTSDMIFDIPSLISYISDFFTLEEGDVILTGTPAGVGPVRDGDVIEGEIPGVTKISFAVVQRR